MSGGHGKGHEAAAGHGHEAAAADHGHGHGHGPAWETATQHERVEVRAAELRALHPELTLHGIREAKGEPTDSSDAEPTAEEFEALKKFVAELPKIDEEDTEFVLETTSDGHVVPCFVPSRTAATRIIEIDGETVVVPELHETLEWVMSSPMDFHTFEEVPAIKEPERAEHDAQHDHAKDE